MSASSASEDGRRCIIAMMGRTAAGKTTTAKRIANISGALYVSEAALKRALRPSYTTQDSLDESLRDLAYVGAIAVAERRMSLGKAVVLDASFHKAYRRRWLYEAAGRGNGGALILYCRCDNIDQVRARIQQRKDEEKNYENHADSVAIFEHIDRGFEEPTKEEFTGTVPLAIVTLDTESDVITDSTFHGRRCSAFERLVAEIETHCSVLLKQFASTKKR